MDEKLIGDSSGRKTFSFGGIVYGIPFLTLALKNYWVCLLQ